MHEEKLDTTASGKGDGQGPVPIFVLQGKGYVWSADGTSKHFFKYTVPEIMYGLSFAYRF